MVARSGGLLGDLQRDGAFEAGRQRFASGVAGLPALGERAADIACPERVMISHKGELIGDVIGGQDS